MFGSIRMRFHNLAQGCVRLLNLLVLLALLTGCGSAGAAANIERTPVINPPMEIPAAIDSFPTIAGRSAQVEQDYQLIAETEQLRLYFKPDTSAILIEDKRDGHILRSSPADLQDNKDLTPAWKSQIALPIQVSYVDGERSQAKNARPEQLGISSQPVQGGVRVTYKYDNLNLAFDVIYAIRGDCLEASLPTASIFEKGESLLVSVDLLAFLGATHDGEDGYIVYPDGSGALLDYKSPHPSDVQKMVGVIYGFDAPSIGSAIGSVYRESVVMPAFGLVSAQASFVGIVTHGDFDAAIGVGRSGKGLSYNHVWSQFIFRRQGSFSLSGGQPSLLYQPDRTTSDRQVRYCLLQDKEANYVGMAARYRQYLMDERGARRMADNTPLEHLAFFMGTEQKTWLLKDMVLMTSFTDADQILKDLEKAGVTKVDVTLWFWNQGQVSNTYPVRLPVDSRLGGEAGLRELAKEIHQRNQRLFLMDDYSSVSPGSTKIQPFLDAVRGVDGLPFGNNDVGYVLNPQVSWRNFAVKDFPKMAAMGANGLELMNFASYAFPDKNTLYPLSRENFAATLMKMSSQVRNQFGAVAMMGSNTYAVPYADRLDGATMDSTHYDFFQDVIPFYQIAVHGLVQYTGNPFNLVSDGSRIFLRYIEYGAIPWFVLTQNNSAQLLRTGSNGVYSSQYSFWRSEVIRQYEIMKELAPLNNQFIVDHRRLAEGVLQTTYEDGTRIIVNYTQQPFEVGNQSVPPMDFLMIKGD